MPEENKTNRLRRLGAAGSHVPGSSAHLGIAAGCSSDVSGTCGSRGAGRDDHVPQPLHPAPDPISSQLPAPGASSPGLMHGSHFNDPFSPSAEMHWHAPQLTPG